MTEKKEPDCTPHEAIAAMLDASFVFNQHCVENVLMNVYEMSREEAREEIRTFALQLKKKPSD